MGGHRNVPQREFLYPSVFGGRGVRSGNVNNWVDADRQEHDLEAGLQIPHFAQNPGIYRTCVFVIQRSSIYIHTLTIMTTVIHITIISIA